MDDTTELFFRCFYQSSHLNFKLLQMLVEPILKILIHTKYHCNAFHFDALFFCVNSCGFPQSRVPVLIVLASLTYKT